MVKLIVEGYFTLKKTTFYVSFVFFYEHVNVVNIHRYFKLLLKCCICDHEYTFAAMLRLSEAKYISKNDTI